MKITENLIFTILDKYNAFIKSIFKKLIPVSFWDRTGLEKRFWVFNLIISVICAFFARTLLDIFYRVANFMIDSWVLVGFLLMSLTLIRKAGGFSNVKIMIFKFLKIDNK